MAGLANMQRTYPGCGKSHIEKKISLKDKKGGKSKIFFLNPTEVENIIFELDDCVVTRRCDFLLYDSNETEHFIELKGRDIAHAIDQFKTSVQQFGVENKHKYCFIVSSRVKILQTIINNYKVDFANEFNAILKIKTVEMTHSLPSPTQ